MDIVLYIIRTQALACIFLRRKYNNTRRALACPVLHTFSPRTYTAAPHDDPTTITSTTTTVMSTTISYYDRQYTDVSKKGGEEQGTQRFKHPPPTEFSNFIFTIQNDYIVDTLRSLTTQMRFQ